MLSSQNVLHAQDSLLVTSSSTSSMDIVRSSSHSSATMISSSSSISSSMQTQNSSAPNKSSSSSAASSSGIPRFALTVTREPANASVRILNIRDTYSDGILLKSGKYHLEVSHPDYNTQNRWVTINDNDMNVQFILTKKDIKTSSSSTKKSAPVVARTKPLMIIVQGGSFKMGSNNDSTSSPAHPVSVNSFYISQYEITFSEYDHFAKETGRSLPSDNRWGRDTRPVINVSWDDAKAYTQWLSKTTGKTYRLPTESEWEYAARANTTTDFWWGNDINGARDRANCRRGCNSKFSGLFGSKTAPVGSYEANAFNIFDMSGNVAEWVEDCYAVDYSQHPKNGSAYQMKQCTRRVVRGGSTKDNAERLTNYARDYYPPEMSQENVGFRVVEEL
jgi:serine/threonine-protein kinase PpkA